MRVTLFTCADHWWWPPWDSRPVLSLVSSAPIFRLLIPRCQDTQGGAPVVTRREKSRAAWSHLSCAVSWAEPPSGELNAGPGLANSHSPHTLGAAHRALSVPRTSDTPSRVILCTASSRQCHPDIQPQWTLSEDSISESRTASWRDIETIQSHRHVSIFLILCNSRKALCLKIFFWKFKEKCKRKSFKKFRKNSESLKVENSFGKKR